jgi:hypothetical protein
MGRGSGRGRGCRATDARGISCAKTLSGGRRRHSCGHRSHVRAAQYRRALLHDRRNIFFPAARRLCLHPTIASSAPSPSFSFLRLPSDSGSAPFSPTRCPPPIPPCIPPPPRLNLLYGRRRLTPNNPQNLTRPMLPAPPPCSATTTLSSLVPSPTRGNLKGRRSQERPIAR